MVIIIEDKNAYIDTSSWQYKAQERGNIMLKPRKDNNVPIVCKTTL
jgi:hypothetical protein